MARAKASVRAVQILDLLTIQHLEKEPLIRSKYSESRFQESADLNERRGKGERNVLLPPKRGN